MRETMANMVHATQDTICEALQEIDGTTYREDTWERDEGGGGFESCVFSDGKVFEKAGVNVSVVYGTLSPQAAKSMGGGQELGEEDLDFYANAISSFVLHPHNPMVPTVHANYRYQRGDGTKPAVGGLAEVADLTPSYLFEEDDTLSPGP